MEVSKAVGPYELRHTIGRGVCGEVFEAFDRAHGTAAAVKLFTKTPGDATAASRLRRDALAAGDLDHPTIASVLDVGEHEGIPWVATELVVGASLAQALRSPASWPIGKVLDVWRQLCEGLAHAHRGGLLHLDLKPSDIRMGTSGDIKIVDFGVRHMKAPEGERPDPTDQGLHYRSPELLAGEHPDGRADVFAVGAIVYEMLTRRKAFPGDSPTDVIRSVSRCDPDLASLPASAFSPGLERMLAASLERDREKRLPSFEEVHAGLVQLVRAAVPRLRTGGRPSPERESLLEELTRARSEERLEDALDVCRRLLALDPDDEPARRSLSEVESVVLTREAEALVAEALEHAAEGRLDLATNLAEKVERLAPWSPRYLELQVYLDEQGARLAADRLVARAESSRAEGRPEEARAALEEALTISPGHTGAAHRLEELEQPSPSAAGSRRVRAATLAADALRHFTANEHERALEAASQALDLDPANRRARDLQRILRDLG